MKKSLLISVSELMLLRVDDMYIYSRSMLQVSFGSTFVRRTTAEIYLHAGHRNED